MNYTKVESNFPYIQFSGISSVTDYHKKICKYIIVTSRYVYEKKINKIIVFDILDLVNQVGN